MTTILPTPSYPRTALGFARAVDHLNGDELSIVDFLVPRPNSSFIYRVKDARLAHAAVLAGDVVIVERGQPLRSDRLALVRLGGEPRLVRVFRDGRQFTFDDLPIDDAPVELGHRLAHHPPAAAIATTMPMRLSGEGSVPAAS